MSPLSMDLRQRIIDAVIEGSESMPRIAERFGVSCNMVQKRKYQWRDLGTIEPQTRNVGRKPLLSESQRKKLDMLVRDNPSLTLEQLRSKIKARLRQMAVRTERKHCNAIAKAIKSVTAVFCLNCFTNAGYITQ